LFLVVGLFVDRFADRDNGQVVSIRLSANECSDDSPVPCSRYYRPE
jgi:hypothetical protein